MEKSRKTPDQLKALTYPFIRKFPGMTLEQIGKEKGGIAYLDWLLGQEWVLATTKSDVTAFLQTFHKDEWEELGEDD